MFAHHRPSPVALHRRVVHPEWAFHLFRWWIPAPAAPHHPSDSLHSPACRLRHPVVKFRQCLLPRSPAARHPAATHPWHCHQCLAALVPAHRIQLLDLAAGRRTRSPGPLVAVPIQTPPVAPGLPSSVAALSQIPPIAAPLPAAGHQSLTLPVFPPLLSSPPLFTPAPAPLPLSAPVPARQRLVAERAFPWPRQDYAGRPHAWGRYSIQTQMSR